MTSKSPSPHETRPTNPPTEPRERTRSESDGPLQLAAALARILLPPQVPTDDADGSPRAPVVQTRRRPRLEALFLAGLLPLLSTEARAEPPIAERVERSIATERVLDEYADDARRSRYAGGVAGAISGGALIGIGFAAEGDDMTASHWLWALGSGMGAVSVASWFFPTKMERLRIEAEGSSQEVVRRRWRELAEKQRSERKVGAVFLAALGGAAMISGGIVLAGAFGDWSEDDRRIVGSALLAGGAVTFGGGLASYWIPTPAERGYAIVSQPRERGVVSVSAVPLRGGVMAGLSGTF